MRCLCLQKRHQKKTSAMLQCLHGSPNAGLKHSCCAFLIMMGRLLSHPDISDGMLAFLSVKSLAVLGACCQAKRVRFTQHTSGNVRMGRAMVLVEFRKQLLVAQQGIEESARS